MHSRIAILLIGVCAFAYVCSAADPCDAPIQQFRQCTDKIRDDRQAESKKKVDELKSAHDQCFTSAGCKAQVDEDEQNKNANHEKQQQCHKDINASLKSKVRECVRKLHPSFDFPPEDQKQDKQGRKIRGGKKDIEKACGGVADKMKAVEDCLKSKRLAKQSEDQQKQRFEQNCANKKKCETALGTSCRTALDKLQTDVCQCNQDTRSDATLQAARLSTPSCQALPTPKPGKQQKQKTKPTCGARKDSNDWCTKGYDAWKQSLTANKAQHKGKKPGGQ
jgi:hypothetical protein